MGEYSLKHIATKKQKKHIVDIGSQDVNGSLRSLAPNNCKYTGIDFVIACHESKVTKRVTQTS